MEVERGIAVEVRRNFHSLRGGYVLPTHQQRQRGGWKECECSLLKFAFHSARVPSPFSLFDGSEQHDLPIRQSYGIDFDSESSTSRYSALAPNFGYGSPCH